MSKKMQVPVKLTSTLDDYLDDKFTFVPEVNRENMLFYSKVKIASTGRRIKQTWQRKTIGRPFGSVYNTGFKNTHRALVSMGETIYIKTTEA